MFPLRLLLRIGRFAPLQEIPQRGRITVDTITVTVANSGWAMNADTSILATKHSPSCSVFCSAAALPLLSGNGISAFATMIG